MSYSGGIVDKFECPEEGNHYYPHPSSCSEFIECNRGVYAEMSCIPGLLYNKERKLCDFPENVVCGTENSSEEGE